MITIVTDSTSYMTEETAKSMGVRVIPMSYAVSNQQYYENYSDKNGIYDQLLAQNIQSSSTSQVPAVAFAKVFKENIKAGHEVLCILISSRLSGTYSSACVAAKQVSSDKIAVVDSLSTAGGLYYLIEKAVKLAAQGWSVFEIAKKLEHDRDKVGVVFSVENMDNLRKSGRLGVVRQSIGNILNIRPILMLKEGAVISKGSVRGRNEQLKELIQLIPKNAEKIAIHYINRTTIIDALSSAIKNQFPKAEIRLMPLGPVLAIHLGLFMIGIAWTEMSTGSIST